MRDISGIRKKMKQTLTTIMTKASERKTVSVRCAASALAEFVVVALSVRVNNVLGGS